MPGIAGIFYYHVLIIYLIAIPVAVTVITVIPAITASVTATEISALPASAVIITTWWTIF